uniref:Uncharacterized protein n=1 Tax=Amphora coffeiformis TaxID=265554 RepID=A0A7S3L428_9STRA|mmetsp:Transcript_16366/g.31113  ORF Transcript_16366/g.31113 Transcript_16366/m.31113 type:complete len:217 (-) Transcript_16366:80-730(-)|eukprot:scaffold4510_cov183-Amphora_coffeaeformis.AAC.71
MQNAMACNVRAISKIESLQYEEAFNLLRTSMLSLTGHLRKSIGIPDIEDKFSSSENGIILLSSGSNPEIERFYSGAFLFSIPGNRVTQRQIDYCTAVCLFNMALACQLEFEVSTNCRKRSVLSAQARVLYLKAYELLQRYPIEPTDNIILLLMALAANVMEIELELGSVDDIMFWRGILEAAGLTSDPLLFVGTSVHAFFDSVYVPPGDVVAAKAA